MVPIHNVLTLQLKRIFAVNEVRSVVKLSGLVNHRFFNQIYCMILLMMIRELNLPGSLHTSILIKEYVTIKFILICLKCRMDI